MDDRAQVLADKAEIVELMTRYCFAVDFRDFEPLRTVFATDVRPRTCSRRSVWASKTCTSRGPTRSSTGSARCSGISVSRLRVTQ